MLKKYGAIFGMLMVRIYDLQMGHYHPIMDKKDAEEAETKVVDAESIPNFEYIYTVATNMAHELGLESVPPLLERMNRKFKAQYLVTEAYKDLEDLQSRLEDHLGNRFFLYVPPAMAHLYEAKQLFGPEVEAKFPGAIDDIEGAGKCLALGQGTACVMHLMRVMEVGLKVLANELGIPYAPSWESYLIQIQQRLSEKYKRKTGKWKRAEPFFRDLSGDLVTVKQAWRNPTMHVVRKYSREEAEEIFKAVKRFMQHLEPRV